MDGGSPSAEGAKDEGTPSEAKEFEGTPSEAKEFSGGETTEEVRLSTPNSFAPLGLPPAAEHSEGDHERSAEDEPEKGETPSLRSEFLQTPSLRSEFLQPETPEASTFEGFVREIRRRVWSRAHYICFGSAANHGALMLGAWAVVRGGWEDEPLATTFPELRGASGVSIGSIGAICVCCGISPGRFAALMMAFPYDLFVADVILDEDPTDADALGETKTLRDGMIRFLLSIPSRRSLMRGLVLRCVVHNVLVEGGVKPSETSRITFSEFAARFRKDLRVLALSITRHASVIFSSATTPDVPVMDACVASMSIPGMFPPVHIGRYGECVDGATIDPYGFSPCADIPRDRCIRYYKYWKTGGYNHKREPGLFPVLLHCLASVAECSVDKTPQRSLPNHAFLDIPLLITVADVALPPASSPASHEHDPENGAKDAEGRSTTPRFSPISAFNLFEAPDVVALAATGARSLEARLLGVWVLVRIAAWVATGSKLPAGGFVE